LEVQETVIQSNQFMGVQWIHSAGSDYFKHCASVLTSLSIATIYIMLT